jgi:glycosyltransferase involved in cell wall biosynthesis
VTLDPAAGAPSPAPVDLEALVADARQHGMQAVHLLAWRDLDDVEAGGSEVYVHEVAARLARAGMEIKLRTSHAAGRRPVSNRTGYTVVRRAGRFWVFPSTVVEEIAGRDGRGDGLVEVWNGVPYFSPLWFRGPRVVILHHSHKDIWKLVLSTPSFAKTGRFIETRVAPPIYRNSFLVTDSDSSRAELVDELGFRADRVAIGEPGIDPRFAPDPDVGRSPRPMVVSVGRLVSTKGFDELMRAVARVRSHGHDLTLVIVGEGYERDQLEDLRHQLDGEDWIRLAGRVSDDELISLYRQAWAVASMSMAEGWGMTITEAAACGTPAVATRITGHVDAVRDGVSGLLAEGFDEMVGALERIVTDEGLRGELAAGALGRAGELDWDRTAATVLRSLLEAAHARSRGRRRR